mmetsp:Transcript_63408/g.200317  ORF Transcript_63408/g.200317 Transcript_63408/m.200317 type:complete len:220 (-) Transcript_63408:458-1117(-)
MGRRPMSSTSSISASRRSTETPRPSSTFPRARTRASLAPRVTPPSTHTLVWSRAGETTSKPSVTCSCTSTEASCHGKASRQPRRRRSIRRSWRARRTPPWTYCARITPQSSLRTSTIAEHCASTTVPTTPTFAGFSRTSSCGRVSSVTASSTGLSQRPLPTQWARARATGTPSRRAGAGRSQTVELLAPRGRHRCQVPSQVMVSWRRTATLPSRGGRSK